MFLSKNHEQTILEIAQWDYIAITAESFLIDRQAAELSKKSLKFYKQFLTRTSRNQKGKAVQGVTQQGLESVS